MHHTTITQSKRRLRWLNVAAILAMLLGVLPFNVQLPGPLPDLGPETASAHNLDSTMVSMFFDPDTQAMLDNRIATESWSPPTPLLRVNDQLGIVIKVVPANGTDTGVGGYVDFFVPNGVTVIDAAYLLPDNTGGFDQVAMKGQALMPDVGAGGDSTVSLTGISRGPNILGVTSDIVDSGNANLGTLPGVYGDTGIFYSTAPETAYQSYSGGELTNNSGDTVGWRTSTGMPLVEWDAWQLAAYGIKGSSNPAYPSSPIIDSNGRGYAPWGFASAVAGPQSGYAWDFNATDYGSLTDAPSKAAIDAATDQFGPWQRIQYPGSQAADDPPGHGVSIPHATGADASTIGFDLNPGNPLPADVKTIRWAIGQLTIGQPEYVWVQVKVDDLTAIINPTGCPVFHAQTFGGDAGGDSGGKDHLWRYYDPTEITWDACVAIGKPANRAVVAVGDNFQYTIKFYNNTGTNLTNVVIKDTLPGGVNFVSAVPAADSGPNPLLWNIGNVATDESVSILVTVQADSSGMLQNEVCVDSATTTEVCTIETVTGGSVPLLKQEKSVSPAAVAPGASVDYTIKISNVGSGPTGDPIQITEDLPPGFTYANLGGVTVNGADVTGSTTVDGSDPEAPIFEVQVGINAGDELLLTFTANVDAQITPGTYCNSYTSLIDTPLTTGSLACVDIGAATVGDTVYYDWNGNGSQDAGEQGIPGIQVCVDGTTYCDTTDANGNYLITGINAPPGGQSFSVAVQNPPTGATPTQTQSSVTLAQGDEDYTVDYGFKPGGSGAIGDLVFEDIGNDGQYNPVGGDVGISGVEVCLYADTDGDGAADVPVTGAGTQGADTHCVVTDGSGIYGFSGLAEGFDYVVVANESDGVLSTHFSGAPFQVSTANPQVVTNLTGTYNDADFGYNEVLPSSIGDEVFADNNGNGIFDAGDDPLFGVTVELYKNGVLLKTTTTDANGNYSFDNLGPGDYGVRVDPDDPNIPSGYAPSVKRYDLTLPTSTDIDTADFPFVQRLSKSVDKDQANPGETLTYNIVVNYPGSELLSNVVVSDTTPTGTTYANSASPTPDTEPGIGSTGVISWTIGSNTPGKDGTVVPALTLPSIKDTYIEHDKPDTSYGTTTSIIVNGAASNSKDMRALIEFDLASVCPGVVQSAELILERTGGNNNQQTIFARRSTATWDEASTWNTLSGGSFATAASDPSQAVDNSQTTWTWDVTDIVNSWCLGTNTNFGFLMESTTDVGDKKHAFSSREGTDTPKLKINGGGPEFSVPVQVTNQLGNQDSLDPAVATDSTGVAHAVFEGKGPTEGSNATDNKINIYYSNDQGTGTWTTPINILTEPPFDVQDSADPRIAVDSSNNLHVVFVGSTNGDSKKNIYYVKSTDGGGTWSTATDISNDLGGQDSLAPDVAVDSTGFVHVVFQGKNSANGDNRINIYYSNDGGTGTWTTPAKLTPEPPFDIQDALAPRIVIDGSDNLHIVFQSQLSSGKKNIFYIKATKGVGGWTYGAAQNVSNDLGGQDSTLPDLAVDSVGNVHIVFRGKNPANGDGKFNIYYATNSGGSFGTPSKITSEPPFDAQDALEAAITAGADDVLYVAFAVKATGDGHVNVYYTTIDGGIVGTAENISNDLGGQDSLTPDVAVTGTSATVVFQGKTGGKKDIFASSVPLAAAGGNLTNHLEASGTLVGGGATITVEQTLTSDTAENNITPGTLNVTGVNGAGATCGGPTLVSGDDDLDGTPGDSVVYEWSCTASLGSGIGSVVFDVDASGDAINFAKATSNSVLVVPTLTFQVKIDGSPGVDPVVNTASVQDNSVIPLTEATAETAILASIGDFVWADLDGLGDQTAGEPGIGGVEVCAAPSSGGVPTGAPATCTTTAGDGSYRIFGLTAGEYVVSTTPSSYPAGYLPTTPSSKVYTIAGASYVEDADFGLRPPGTSSIGDTVWIDANEDGVVGGSEEPLPNVTVNLYDSTGTLLIATTTSDANGNYSFDGLHGDTYQVQVDETSTVTVTNSVGATTNTTIAAAMDLVSGANPATVVLPDATDIDTVDFGYNWAGSIGDYTYYDPNATGDPNGVGTSAAPLVTTLLYEDTNGNGKVDPGEPILEVGETDANGFYLFDNLPPGDYIANADEQTVESPTTPGLYTVMVGTTGTKHPVTLAPAQDYLDADFGFIEAAELEGHVFHDVDHNGIKGGVEPGLGPVEVTLTGYDVGSNPVTLTTDTSGSPSGEYSFIVPPGTYTITYSSGDVLAIDSGLTETTTPTSITRSVNAGQEVKNLDFGVDHAGSIGDLVWLDDNQNGSQDTGEPGISGITVELYLPNEFPGTHSPFMVQATDGNGNYLFEGLDDGTYTVNVLDGTGTALDGYTLAAGSNNPKTATVTAGGSDLNADFGYDTATVTLSGRVYDDGDNSGNDNGGADPGFDQVDVTVVCDGSTFVTQSDNTGAWSVVVPSGSDCTAIDVDENDVPPTYTPNETATAPGVVTGDVTGLNFGFVNTPASISGTVCDVNGSGNAGNGQCDGGEPGIPGVTVTLVGFDDNNVPFTVGADVTDGNGDYSFPDLGPGTYQIQETNLPNYDSVSDADGGNPDNITVASLAVGQNLTGQDFEDEIISVGTPDYTISKTYDGLGAVRTGDTITFTIRITNTGDVPLTTIPLEDRYATQFMTYVGATIEPDDNINDGVINWADLTAAPPHGTGVDLAPSEWVEVKVEFVARLDTTLLPGSATDNTAEGKGVDAGGQTVPDKSDTASVQIFNPTGIALADRGVAFANDVVTLSWETVDESQIVAFNLYRVDLYGGRVQLNGQPIEAQKAGQTTGALYSYEDATVDGGFIFRYELELLTSDGAADLFGMGSVQVGGEQIFLPVISSNR